ncbi:FAD:protein FMN transferase [Candidatus Acidulodesulfobacterium sp. H_13]|uniref:FAD:protein FMN transferase n=1 Tax=Candidatus Acidulodesulfobacterium sp. H_13 TaxID=3395470 RepID=UPI003AF6861D
MPNARLRANAVKIIAKTLYNYVRFDKIFMLGTSGLLDPLDRNKIIKVIRLTNSSVETSANYENHFFYKGKSYGHIMNPATGMPAETDTLSDTIIVKNKDFKFPSTVADALSCSFFILNKKQISNVINKFKKPVKVILIKKLKGHLEIYNLSSNS